jgi:DNA-binding Xre family transcriptional regulator
MSFSFTPLWKLLIDRNMTREQLRIALGISPNTMAKMTKGQFVSMEIIGKICNYLNVGLDQVVEYKQD